MAFELRYPLPVLLAGMVIVGVFTFTAMYIGFCIMLTRYQNFLRDPPAGWRDYLLKAADLGAALPSFGDKTHVIRRQLLLYSDDASKYSSTRPLTISKMPKDSFKPKFNEKGERVGRKIIFGFFHPFADAGGGGERVLWAAVRETLQYDPLHVCAIYMAKNDDGRPGNPELILERVEARFGIQLDSTRIAFMFLDYGSLVKADTWPRFTLIGQAIGSVFLAYQAISTLVPDVFVDTAGYPFAYPIVDWLCEVPIASYIHYPVVQADMMKKCILFSPKWFYWRLFTQCYKYMGRYNTLAVTNSTWTRDHMRELWKTYAVRPDLITTVYPPCATQDFEDPATADQTQRKPNIVYLAQFRPEKRHELVLREYAKFVDEYREAKPDAVDKPHLVLVGSTRGDQDAQTIYSLRLLARELELGDDYVTFMLDAPWTTVQDLMRTATVGLNAMWNEHFGMVVVEYMAAGLIPVCHDSAGPRMDILVEQRRDNDDGKQPVRPGVLFTSEEDPDYDASSKSKNNLSLHSALAQVLLDMSESQMQHWREVAYQSAQRFSDAQFDSAWALRVKVLLKLEKMKFNRRKMIQKFD